MLTSILCHPNRIWTKCTISALSTLLWGYWFTVPIVICEWDGLKRKSPFWTNQLPVMRNILQTTQCRTMKSSESFLKSKDSKLGDKETAAPTAKARTVKVKQVVHPWLRETLPKIILQYLSASLKCAWRAASVSESNTFSFCSQKKVNPLFASNILWLQYNKTQFNQGEIGEQSQMQ